MAESGRKWQKVAESGRKWHLKVAKVAFEKGTIFTNYGNHKTVFPFSNLFISLKTEQV